jgi:hypothetical protein
VFIGGAVGCAPSLIHSNYELLSEGVLTVPDEAVLLAERVFGRTGSSTYASIEKSETHRKVEKET